MLRPVMAVLTVASIVYSYFEIQHSLPLLTARMATHAGRSVPVTQVLSTDLYGFFFLQLLLGVVLLVSPYVAAENIHFGTWCLGRCPVEQRYRVLPLLRELMGLLALLVSFFFASSISLAIQAARSHGPLLPREWLDDKIHTELAQLAALAVVCGLIIYFYIQKFNRVAGRE